jgi:hypothetical protein
MYIMNASRSRDRNNVCPENIRVYNDCCEYPHVGMMVDGFMAVEISPKKRVN